MKLTRIIPAGLLALYFTSCLPPAPDKDKVEIKRLDLAIYDSRGMGTIELDSMNRALKPGIEALHKINMAAGREVPGRRLESLTSKATDVFTPDVRKRISDLGVAEKTIQKIKGYAEENLASITFPSKIYAVVWPYNQSVVIVDSVMLIALNQYLGKDYEGYEGFEEYRKREKEQKRIPYDVAEALVRTYYPYRSSKSDVASRLLYEGAVLTAVKELTGEEDDRKILSYTDDMMEWANSNEGKIWTTLVNRQLLFSSSSLDAEKLFNPSPATSAIHPEAPGRMGRYIGLRIIESLREVESEVTLTQILSPVFYDSDTALQRSRYSPR